MYTVKYDPKVDNWSLLQVLKKRDKKLAYAEELPKFGCVVYEEDFLIAAGFIRKCEGGYGLLEGYITDPTMPAELRNQALDMLTERLIKGAKDLKISCLLSFSMDDNTLTRSQRHGFALTDYKVISRKV